jgi:hypothetical protein
MMSTILEVTLAVLLLACLFYCWRLDRKLSALRNSEQGIRTAAAELNAAVLQADAAIKALRVVAQESGRDLQPRADVPRTPQERASLTRSVDPARRRAL